MDYPKEDLPYFLNYKHSLKTHVLYYNTLEQVSAVVEKIPRHDLLKNDAELLLLVCRLIEIMVVKGNKLNKKELVVDVYKNVFNESDEYFYTKLRSDIDFLHSNKQIRGVNMTKRVLFYMGSIVKSIFI